MEQLLSFMSTHCGMVALESFLYTSCTFMLFSLLCRWLSEIKQSLSNINKKEESYHANVPTIRRLR